MFTFIELQGFSKRRQLLLPLTEEQRKALKLLSEKLL